MRRIRNLFALAILFAFFSNFSNAQNAPSFRIEPASISGVAGDTVTVKVIARDFVKVEGLQFAIGWDSSVLKCATKLSVLFATSHRVILEGGGGFAVRDYEIFMTYFDQAAVGQTIQATEDSIFFSFKVVLKKDVSNTSICFSNKIDKEAIFYDGNGVSQNFEGFAITCGALQYRPQKLVLSHNGLVRTYSEKDTIIELEVKAYGGLRPYFYDWGKQSGVSKIRIPRPLQDTLINVKVRDAANDSIAIVIKLVKKITVTIDKIITLGILKGATQQVLVLGLGPDKALYTYDWGNLPIIHSTYDTATFTVPKNSSSYVVEVVGPQATSTTYRIDVKILPFELGQFLFYRYFVGDTALTVSVSTGNGKYPFRYLWDNGDSTSASRRTVGDQDHCSASVTITDAYGQIVSGNASRSRDTNAFVRFSNPVNKYDSNEYYFEKNPVTGVLHYQVRIYVKKQIVYSDSGFTTSNYLKWNYINNSYFDTAFVHVSYYLEHEKFPVKEQKIVFVMAPKQAAPLTVEAKNQYYCKLDSSLILNAKVSGGVPPYYYDWGTLGAGYEVDWMPVEPTQSTTYPVTVTDQSGQKQVKEFQIRIGEVSIINKVSYSKKELCANSEFTLNVDKSLKIEKIGAQYAFSYTYYDKDWKFLFQGGRSDDMSQLNFGTGLSSNVANTKIIIKVKSIGSREFCIDPNGKEFVDTITVLPSPAFAVKYERNDSVCEGSILPIYSPPQDSSNLPNVKYEWSLYDSYDHKKMYSDQPFDNYVIRSKQLFYYYNNKYYFNDHINQGARLTYTNSGCSTDRDFKQSVVIPYPKFLLKNDNQLINSNAGVLPIEVTTNLEKVQYSLSYLNQSLTGSLLEDQSFPLSGVLVNNTTTSQKLGIIVKSSLFGCEGQVDTAFIEVRKGIQDNYDFTSSDEMVMQFKSSARKVADDLGADFQYLLSPNPTSSELTFSFGAQSSSSASVGIYSISGQQIMDFPFQTQKGLNAFHCSLDRLPAGSYILLFKSTENVKTERFEKL